MNYSALSPWIRHGVTVAALYGSYMLGQESQDYIASLFALSPAWGQVIGTGFGLSLTSIYAGRQMNNDYGTSGVIHTSKNDLEDRL